MKQLLVLFLTGFIFLNTMFSQAPMAIRKEFDETIFGIKISDPYRYLENLSDTSVENWYRQQSAYAKEQLNKLPNRQKIMQDFMSFGMSMANTKNPIIITDKYLIYSKIINPMQRIQEYHLVYRKTNLDTVLFRSNDPAVVDTSQYILLADLRLSPDENYMCLVCNKKDGSEFQYLRFFHIPSLKMLPDIVLKRFRRWMPDSRSIAVLALQTKDTKSDKLYEHTATEIYTIGKNSYVDIFSARSAPHLKLDPAHITRVVTSTESPYMAGMTASAAAYIHHVYVAPLGNITNISRSWKPLLNPGDSVSDDNASTVIIHGNYIYYKSVSGNPNYTLRRVSILSGKKEIIINDPERVLHDFTIGDNKLYYILRNGLQCELYSSSLNALNKTERLSMPKEGMAQIAVTPGNKRVLLTITSWMLPRQEWLFDLAERKWTINPLNSLTKLPWDGKIETKEVWVKARDGMSIPLTLIYPAKFNPDGQAAALITGYGSYGEPLFPSMNPMNLLPASKGIVIAIAHVRGGGELGDSWHLGGMKKNKPNSWNDFIDCAEWLVNNKYAHVSKLIAEGTSAGGMLIGRAVTERPDLFCGAIINVGVLNPTRFAYTPNGANHFDEFGNPALEEDFKSLYEMDAYLHIKDGIGYPAMYITAGWNDPRVIAWQPGKFAARAQNSSVPGKPIYFVTNFNAGHDSQFATLDDIINRFVFLYKQWNFDPFEKKTDQ